MNEKALLDFFTGKIHAQALAEALGAATDAGRASTRYAITDMEEDFRVTPHHLTLVCDAFLAGKLTVAHLQAIGFMLLASETFFWDGADSEGERVTSVASDWATPEINCPITASNVERWRAYLVSQR